MKVKNLLISEGLKIVIQVLMKINLPWQLICIKLTEDMQAASSNGGQLYSSSDIIGQSAPESTHVPVIQLAPLKK